MCIDNSGMTNIAVLDMTMYNNAASSNVAIAWHAGSNLPTAPLLLLFVVVCGLLLSLLLLLSMLSFLLFVIGIVVVVVVVVVVVIKT